MVRDLVVARERRVDRRAAAQHVGDHRERDQVADDHAHRRAQYRIGPAPVSAGPHVASSLASCGPELEHDLAQEEHRRSRDVVRVREECAVAGIRSSFGVDAAHGENRLRRSSGEQVAAARSPVDEETRAVRVPALELLAVSGRRAGHHPAGLLLDPSERGDVVVRAEQDPRLARAGLGRQIGLPLDEPVRAGGEPARHLRRVPVTNRPPEHGEREAVDLDEDDAGRVGANLFARTSSHPLDHTQRVHVVVVDAEGDLQDERCGGGGEGAHERPAERVDRDRVGHRIGGEPEECGVQREHEQEAADDRERQPNPSESGDGQRVQDGDHGHDAERSQQAVDPQPGQHDRSCEEPGNGQQPADEHGSQLETRAANDPCRRLLDPGARLIRGGGLQLGHGDAVTQCFPAARLRPSGDGAHHGASCRAWPASGA